MSKELILVKDEVPALADDIREKLVETEKAIKVLEETRKDLREKLLNEMADKGIIKIETDELSITYKEAYDRENFDKKQFRKDNPELYDSYISFGVVAPSIVIKVK